MSRTRAIRCEVCGYAKVATSAAACPVCNAPDFAIVPGVGTTREEIEKETGLRGDRALAKFTEIKAQQKREFDAKEKREAAERQELNRRQELAGEKRLKSKREFNIGFFVYTAIATLIAWAIFKYTSDPDLESGAGWSLMLLVPLSVFSFLNLIGAFEPSDGG